MNDFIIRIRTEDGRYVNDYDLSEVPTRSVGRADRRSPVSVVIKDDEGNVIETFETTANRRGIFRFKPEELPDGDYTIEITANRRGESVTKSTPIQIDTGETTAPLEEIRQEIYEDSSSDGPGNEGSNNGVEVSAEDLSQIANNVYRFTDAEGNAVLEARIKQAISAETGFSNLPTDEEIQALVDAQNEDLSMLFGRQGLFNEDYVRNWDVSQVKNMSEMFLSALSFNQDIGGWDVGEVTDMSRMFLAAQNFNQDIGGWDVGNVTNMSGMFGVAHSFNQDIGNWDVGNVTDMFGMFGYASSFNQDIGAWDVSKVTDMSAMFIGRSQNDINQFPDFERNSFNQNIGGWDISSLEDAANMLDHNNNFSL